MGSRQRDWKGIALSVGLVLVLYWPAVLGQGFFFQRDVWLYWVPHIEWAARTLASGHLPQWNPFVGFGAPFMADPSFQFFYPPAVLNWILPAGVAYSLLVVGHATLGAVGAFQLLRPRLHSRASALVGAAAFVAAGPIVSSANLWHHFSSAMYMPWVLDAFLRVRGGRGRVGRLGFLTGLQALAGSADVCVMTGLGLLFLLPLRRRRLRKLMPRLAGALGLCLMIAAVQWLPTMMLASKAARSSLDPGNRLHWSVSPASVIDFVLPLSGAAHAISGGPTFLEDRLRFIPWMYLGASTLPLLVLGALRAPRGALLLLFSILLSLGRYGPIAPWLSQLPLGSMFRFPSKVLWLVSICWATLAAIGCKELSRRSEPAGRPGAIAGLALLLLSLGLFVVNPSTRADSEDFQQIGRVLPWAPLALGSLLMAASLGRRGVGAVALIVVFDLVGIGQTFNVYASGEMFRTRPALVDELQSEKARRIFVFQKSRGESRFWKVPDHWTKEEAYYFGQGQFLLPPQAVRWSIRGSFDGDFTGLALPEYSALSAAVGRGDLLEAPLLRLAGVTHAIRFPGAGPAEFPVVARVPTFHDQPVLVLRVPDPLPPAYVVHQVRPEPSMSAALGALADPSFDPASEVIRLAGDRAESAGGGEAATSTAILESESGGSTVVRARLSAPGTLVVLNALSQGWRARVDGKAQDVLPANLIFQSVDLDAGEHLVELDYQTPGLQAGFLLSALAWGWMGFRLTGPRPPKRTRR